MESVVEENFSKSVYNFIEIVGTSTSGWEEAVEDALSKADRHLTNMRVAQVARMDARIGEGGIMQFRARVRLSFKHEVEPETL